MNQRIITDFTRISLRTGQLRKSGKLPGGDTYTLCYLRMLALASKCNGRIYSEGIGSMTEEISLELNETRENISATLFILETCGLIERISDTEIFFRQCRHDPESENSASRREGSV